MTKVRKGIFGGSFNPPHYGHLLLAQDAAEAFGLERVVFLPCARPPHKDPASLAEGEDRLEMLRCCVEGNPLFEVSDLELRRQGMSYSIDTVDELRAREPDTDWFFIIGQDSLFELYTWRRIEDLLERCSFITLARPGFQSRPISSETLHLEDPWPARLSSNLLEARLIGISSTEIRLRIRDGKGIRYMVPGPVEAYLLGRDLYR